MHVPRNGIVYQCLSMFIHVYQCLSMFPICLSIDKGSGLSMFIMFTISSHILPNKACHKVGQCGVKLGREEAGTSTAERLSRGDT